MPLIWFGFVTTGMTLCQTFVLLRIETVERIFGGPRRYLTLSALIPGLAYLALAAAPSPWTAAALTVLVAGFGLSRSAIINNYMHKHVESSRRATVLSAAEMARHLSMAAVFPIVGWAAEKSLSWTFAGLGAATLACAAASSVRESDLLD